MDLEQYRFQIDGEVLHFSTEIEAKAGLFMVAAPQLKDGHFDRSVVYICEHNQHGSFGLILNKELPMRLTDVLDSKYHWSIPLYQGGPVQTNTLHFLHSRSDLHIGSKEVSPGIFWGGKFNKMLQLIEQGEVKSHEVRFFAGYSGWVSQQLGEEIRRDTWYVTQKEPSFLFNTKSTRLWSKTLKSMGGKYQLLIHYPEDPGLN